MRSRAASTSPTTERRRSDAAAPPSRYDITRTNLLIIMPTFAAGYRLLDWLDVGAAVQVVYATFDLANANRVPTGACPSAYSEDPGCDAYGAIKTSGVTATYM